MFQYLTFGIALASALSIETAIGMVMDLHQAYASSSHGTHENILFAVNFCLV